MDESSSKDWAPREHLGNVYGHRAQWSPDLDLKGWEDCCYGGPWLSERATQFTKLQNFLLCKLRYEIFTWRNLPLSVMVDDACRLVQVRSGFGLNQKVKCPTPLHQQKSRRASLETLFERYCLDQINFFHTKAVDPVNMCLSWGRMDIRWELWVEWLSDSIVIFTRVLYMYIVLLLCGCGHKELTWFSSKTKELTP